jgi:hypothetical protein
MKKLTLSLLVLALIAAFVAPSGLAAAKGKKPAGPVVVATDDAADWGANVDPTIAPAGNAIGQELVEASIGLADAKTVNFVIKVASLPPTGGIPEGARYSWDFTVNGDAFGMSGNFTDYARGVCYPAHTDSCPPPKDPGQQPFFIRQGPCTIGAGGLGECNLVATVKAVFDSAAGTVTIPVPLEAIGAKAGSKIGPGTNSIFGATIYTSPAAVTASANGPHDTMVAIGTFTVPKGK